MLLSCKNAYSITIPENNFEIYASKIIFKINKQTIYFYQLINQLYIFTN